jgi:tetratricopeptide (TPR) repeat protein
MTNQLVVAASNEFDLLVRANELKSQRDYRGMLAFYQEALELFGENVDLLAMIAFCHFALDNFQEAIAWIERAIVLTPDDDRLHTDLAEYCSLGTLDYERAAQEYRKAIQLNSGSFRALIGIAALYGLPEEVVTLNESVDWLERAVKLEPNDPNYHFRLGEFYQEEGRSEDGMREWRKALLCTRPLDPGPMHAIDKAFER